MVGLSTKGKLESSVLEDSDGHVAEGDGRDAKESYSGLCELGGQSQTLQRLGCSQWHLASSVVFRAVGGWMGSVHGCDA
jgi:hypothetical protein